MEQGLFLSMLGFLWVAAITPGPNNMLLTSSGANFGFVRSIPVMVGIMAGMQTLLLCVSLGIGGLLLAMPSLHTTLKVLGSAYLLWLSWKIATARYEELDASEKETAQPVKFYQGLLLQFLNPKAWLMGLGAIASFSLSGSAYVASIWAISFGMLLVNLVSGLIWLGFGTVIGRLLHSRRSWKIFNLSMGILTAACVFLFGISG